MGKKQKGEVMEMPEMAGDSVRVEIPEMAEDGVTVEMPEMEEDSVTVEVFPRERRPLEIGFSSIIGTRKSQQDSIFGHVNGTKALAIVCDGMGGLSGGEQASRLAVESLMKDWFENEEIGDIPAFLEQAARKADEQVFRQKDDRGEPLKAGTTIVAAVVRGDELYWLSVGDSRIYIIRGNEIMAVNQKHNYRMTLNSRLKKGEITKEEYAAQEYRAEALISYLGMGNISLMDINQRPFLLEDGDVVVLCSDGLYKSLSEEEIFGLVQINERNTQKMAEALTEAALEKKKVKQDNTSVIVLRCCLGKMEKTEMEDVGCS
ncbi:MAG: protein phosphatase 2C domain-containing protein [Roseburia sp.]|nr:protein phosphatase 2C domain-containing protein [Roseburia sp.]MCM1278910.1 protein phosphatase 2C domain-containing protein [Robinsoniella sp.]